MSNNFLKYNSDIIWSLPCNFQHEPLVGMFRQLIRKLNDEVEFKTEVYGAPASIWTGEIFPDIYDELDKDTLDTLFEYYEEVDATPVFTFTSTRITQEDLEDKNANFILDYALEKNSKFIVYDDKLKDYIKAKKSDAFVIASHIKAIENFQSKNRAKEEETEFYNALLDQYDRVLLRPEYSKNVLAKTPEVIKDLSKVEVIINSNCAAECASCLEHIKQIDELKEKIERADHINCPIPFLFAKNLYAQNTSLSSEEINKLYDAGVRHFRFDKEKRHGQPMDVLGGFIASQIFNTDGANYLLFSSLLNNELGNELEYFKEKLANSPYFRKVLNQDVQR